MRRFNEFSGLWRAPIFSKAFFADVARNWKGIGVRYLLFLVGLTWLLALTRCTIDLSAALKTEIRNALRELPAIEIHNGIASGAVEQPYIMKDDRGRPIFVFDTTGTVNKPSDVGARLLITQTEMVQEDRPGTLQRRRLSDLPIRDISINQNTVLAWVHTVRNWLIPAGMIFLGLFSFVVRLLGAVLLAAMGLALNAAFGAKLTYPALLRLAIVSMTGPLLIDTLTWLFDLNIGCWKHPALWALTLTYFILAIKLATDASQRLAGFPVDSVSPYHQPDNPPPLPRDDHNRGDQSPFP